MTAMSKAWDQLCALLKDAKVRMTFDARRNNMDPCWGCHTKEGQPHKLVSIGTYFNGDEITRPFCATCEPIIRKRYSRDMLRSPVMVVLDLVKDQAVEPIDRWTMSHASHNILKACPFCAQAHGLPLSYHRDRPDGSRVFLCRIVCNRCSGEVMYSAKALDAAREGAVARWERRPDDVLPKLDLMIEHWRAKRAKGDKLARYYIDALQSARRSLFGDTKP